MLLLLLPIIIQFYQYCYYYFYNYYLIHIDYAKGLPSWSWFTSCLRIWHCNKVCSCWEISWYHINLPELIKSWYMKDYFFYLLIHYLYMISPSISLCAKGVFSVVKKFFFSLRPFWHIRLNMHRKYLASFKSRVPFNWSSIIPKTKPYETHWYTQHVSIITIEVFNSKLLSIILRTRRLLIY